MLAAKVLVCIWLDQCGLIYYELLKVNEINTGDSVELNKCDWAEHCSKSGHNTREARQSDSTDWNRSAPHYQPVKSYFKKSKWEILPHLQYSAYTAPSNYYLFLSMTHGPAHQPFQSYKDISKGLQWWIESKDGHFYGDSIRALPGRCENLSQSMSNILNDSFGTIFHKRVGFSTKNSMNLVVRLVVCYIA